eukprot:TRINITY_DN7007_c0_g1_i6.p1 TRINITY_DN7007_c0_g1~~TRINITY_DN7007_c0_g1_i6.p1  ORF type:complete len:275 (-),score=42.33 TRINITY_DN7007_c0_g1_i6:118-942(-)
MALPVLIGATGVGLATLLPGFSSFSILTYGSCDCQACELDDATFVIVTEEGKSKCRYYPYGMRQQADKDFDSLSFRCLSRILFTCENGVLSKEIRRGGVHSFSFNTIRGAARKLSLHNKTFLQHDSLGLASFHFLTEKEAYISYESSTCSTWCLDDGSNLPARKYFQDTSFDVNTNTFRGVIDWAPTSFCGDSRWEYEMVFDPSLTEIIDGRILHFTPGATDWQCNQVLAFTASEGEDGPLHGDKGHKSMDTRAEIKETCKTAAHVIHYKRWHK